MSNVNPDIYRLVVIAGNTTEPLDLKTPITDEETPRSIYRYPENGLHPLAQVELINSKDLLATGEYSVVYTHSPYIYEALVRKYADKHSALFLYQDDDGFHASGAFEKVFDEFSKPFEIFRNQDAETLQDK